MEEVELSCRLLTLKVKEQLSAQGILRQVVDGRTIVNFLPSFLRILRSAAFIEVRIWWGVRPLGGGFASSPEGSRRASLTVSWSDSSLSARFPRLRRGPVRWRGAPTPFLPLLLTGATCFLRGAFLLTTVGSSESNESDDSALDRISVADLRPRWALEDGPALEEEKRAEVLGVAMDTLSGRSDS